MFANSEMLGASFDFPQTGLERSPGSTPAGGDAAPAGADAGLLGLLDPGGILSSLQSYLPQIDPSFAGGLIPGQPTPGGSAAQLPTGLLPAVQSFQQQHDIAVGGDVSSLMADALKYAR